MGKSDCIKRMLPICRHIGRLRRGSRWICPRRLLCSSPHP